MRVEFYKHGLGDEEVEEVREALGSRFLAYGPAPSMTSLSKSP